MVRGFVLKIIFELLIDTSHISTVLSRGTNRRLALDEWIMARGISPISRSKDVISCVSSLQRHLWSDPQNAAIKQSLVGGKWSDEMLPGGYRNRWVIFLFSKFHNSITFSDRFSTARYWPLGENWVTATPVTSNSLSDISFPISHSLTRMWVECGPSSIEATEDPSSSIQCTDAIFPSWRL